MEDGDGINETGRTMDRDAKPDEATKCFGTDDSVVSSKSFIDSNITAFGANPVNGNFDEKLTSEIEPCSGSTDNEFCVTDKDFYKSSSKPCISEDLSDVSGVLESIEHDSEFRVSGKNDSEFLSKNCSSTTEIKSSESENVDSVIAKDETGIIFKIENTHVDEPLGSLAIKKEESKGSGNSKSDMHSDGDSDTLYLPCETDSSGKKNDGAKSRSSSVEDMSILNKNEGNGFFSLNSSEDIRDMCTTSTSRESGARKDLNETLPTSSSLILIDDVSVKSGSTEHSSSIVGTKFKKYSVLHKLGKSTTQDLENKHEPNDRNINVEAVQQVENKLNNKNNIKLLETAQELGNKYEVSNKSTSKTVEAPSRVCDRTRSSRKKSEDKGSTSNTLDFNNAPGLFSFHYNGFKRTNDKSILFEYKKVQAKTKRTKWNPFNPAWKRDFNNDRLSFSCNRRKNVVDCNTLQTEYAQYLGLQPLVKFRCSNCGNAEFHSFSSLSTHQQECRKNGKVISNAHSGENTSASIRVTRKVFLCSSCGTYYENCDLFLHMREFHRRYICLFCLYMTHTPELLSEHLREKHEIVYQNYLTIEELQQCSPQSFFLLCLRCDKVFTEVDDSSNHKCVNRNPTRVENPISNKKIKLEPSPGTSQSVVGFQSISTLSDSPVVKSKPTVPKFVKEVIQIKSPNFIEITDISRNEPSTSQNMSGIVSRSELFTNQCKPIEMPQNELCISPSKPEVDISWNVPSTSHNKPIDISHESASNLDKPILTQTCEQIQYESNCAAPELTRSAGIDSSSNSLESVNKTIESMELQIPKGIEIKPLLPGEHKCQDTELKNDSRPGIEIFPILTPEQKSKIINKTKSAGLKRTLKKKVSGSLKKLLKNFDQAQFSEIKECNPSLIVSPSIPIQASSELKADITSEEMIDTVVTPSFRSNEDKPIENEEARTDISNELTKEEDERIIEQVNEIKENEGKEVKEENCSKVQEIDADLKETFDEKGRTLNESKNVEQDMPEAEEKFTKEKLMDVSNEEQEQNKDVLEEQSEVNSTHPTDAEKRSPQKEENNSLPTEIIKLKLPGETESDNESDDSHRLSLIVDENTNNSDIEPRKNGIEEKTGIEDCGKTTEKKEGEESSIIKNEISDNIALAREDVAAMALTLEDKIENVSIQLVLKECVRTSCLSCNFCRHAVRIAVNGKQLALHLLSEHRYTPVKNETSDDVIRKLKGALEELEKICLNTESYDSSDPSIHVPYDKENNFDCFHCNYSSTNHKDLYAHKKKIHVKSLLLCIMCKISFHSYSELICHLCTGCYIPGVVRSTDLSFRCCFCRLDTIPSAFRLMVHLRKSHHTCDICLEICSDQQKLSTHMWKHKLNHLCYRCGIAYASKPDITKHLFWKHGTESVLCKKCLQKKWPHVYHFCIPPTSFNCEECNISFSKAVALKVHKRTHSNDFPYSCTQCEKKFVSKKLLGRHVDRHSAVAQRKESVTHKELKDEIVSVADTNNEKKETSQTDASDTSKDPENIEIKDKCHKKHKKDKDKEKKEKKVVDVYDLPPLNLSSESDSSDDEKHQKISTQGGSKKEKDTAENVPKNDNVSLLNDITLVTKESINETSNDKNVDRNLGNDNKPSEIKSSKMEGVCNDVLKPEEGISDSLFNENSLESNPTTSLNSFLPLIKDGNKPEDISSNQNDQVEGIWENFYRTNAQNPNLPYPLCAMKSEEAYNIIMGDHDYCQHILLPEVIQPTTSVLETPSLSDDKLEETTPVIAENSKTPPGEPNDLHSSTPVSMSKKKFKSPKKKSPNKTSEDNNSSSSDSSSDTDSSSCSCGTNCSCSSSSTSNNSSSSSSDSDSSSPEDKTKQDKRKKKREKKTKVKNDTKETTHQEEVDVIPVVDLEDPPIRESELETDETTTDEEFYDRHPKNIADQQLAEKRQSLMIASGVPINNSNGSPVPQPSPQPQEAVTPPLVIETPKQKVRTKRRKKPSPKTKNEKKLPNADAQTEYSDEPKPYTMFHQNTVPPKQKTQQKTPVHQNPLLVSEAGGSGSETDNTRLGKRRRIKNKFYGYSSGDEDEKEKVHKWKKSETTSANIAPKYQPTSTTPRIQLTVPKQVIRKPNYHKSKQQQQQLIQQQQTQAHQQARTKMSTTSDSSDSDSDIDERVSRPQTTASSEDAQKNEKDVYCYCRCPYDEVSEMIACDDKNCKIEWFHFECVGILVPPRGQWFCPGCRKARGLPT